MSNLLHTLSASKLLLLSDIGQKAVNRTSVIHCVANPFAELTMYECKIIFNP